MKVVDSSSLAKYLHREENWQKINELLEQGCVTIELSLKELGNSLWKRVSRGELPERTARRNFKDLLRLRPFKLASQEGLYEGAADLAFKCKVPFYDALFMELAKQMKTSLVTSDSKQAEACRACNIEFAYIP